jgi:hypothetical protein
MSIVRNDLIGGMDQVWANIGEDGDVDRTHFTNVGKRAGSDLPQRGCCPIMLRTDLFATSLRREATFFYSRQVIDKGQNLFKLGSLLPQ